MNGQKMSFPFLKTGVFICRTAYKMKILPERICGAAAVVFLYELDYSALYGAHPQPCGRYRLRGPEKRI